MEDVIPTFFLGAPVAQPVPTKFGIVTYSPKPSCVPNLKLLASTVAKIRRGPTIFLMLPWPTLPPILVLNVVFW